LGKTQWCDPGLTSLMLTAAQAREPVLPFAHFAKEDGTD
jgi:hypothetical protein